MLKDKFVIGVSSLVAVTIVIGAFLSSSRTIATSTSAQATVNVAEACTMSSTLTTPHSATIPNGTYQENIGITTLKVTCNDSQGYAIYAVGYTGDEIGGTNSTKLVGASSNIDTGTATSGNTSSWAMKISTSGSSFIGTIDNSFNNYHTVPSEYAKVAHFNSSTDAGPSANGSTYQTTYAAFVSSTQLAGNYTGKVKYTMVHPANEFMPHEVACAAGKICYNPNTAIVEGQMGTQSATNNSSRVLYASRFKKQGYGFAGWSDAYDYESNSNAVFYGPNETITAPSDVQTNGLSLYAVWIKSAGNLQDSNTVASICNNLVQSGTNVTKTIDSVSALTDQRDGNTYAIAKLADGKCWMIDNLRLEGKASRGDTNKALSQGYAGSTGYGSFVGLADSESANFYSYFNDMVTPNSVYYANGLQGDAYMDIGGSQYPGYRMPRYNNSYSRTYGNYYTWRAAVADTTPYYDDISITDTSICPAGWRLPRGGDKTTESSNDFWNLVVNGINDGVKPANYDDRDTPYYDGESEVEPVIKKITSFPNNFLYSGDFFKSSTERTGTHGNYWSSTILSNGTGAKGLMFYSSRVIPGTSGAVTYYGNTVRCLFSNS